MSNRRKALALTATELVLAAIGPVVMAVADACGVRMSRSYLDAIGVLCIIVLSFFALILLIECISVFKISDSTLHTVFLAAFLLGALITSPDFFLFLQGKGARVSGRAMHMVNFALYVLLTLSVLSFQRALYGVRLPRHARVACGAIAVLCVGAHVGLDYVGMGYGYLAFVLYTLLLALLWGAIARQVFRAGRADASFCTTSLLLAATVGNQLGCTLCTGGAIGLDPYGVTCFYAICQIALFALTYIAFAMRTDRNALKASEYKLKYERVKAATLRAQIKPHYIFNSLAAIQGLYRRSTELGDRAMTLFSRNMRANVEADNVDLIPFERELDNIQAYIELENLCFGREYNVIFDIECTDFQVPALSLQPYIENAIRHSNVHEKPDGCILISSHPTPEGGVEVQVRDNGVGFDVARYQRDPGTSCGLKNSTERFEMLMGVTPRITSAPGQGTCITVLIPPTPPKGGSFHEDHHR